MTSVKLVGGKKTSRKLASLGQISVRAAASARKKATTSGRRDMVKRIGQTINLPASRIRNDVKRDEWAVYTRQGAREKPPTLAAYKGRFLRRGKRYAGYKVRTWKGLGMRVFKSAFGIPGKAPPFHRKTAARYPIEPMYGPRIGRVFDQNADIVREHMQSRIVAEWRRAIRGRLARP